MEIGAVIKKYRTKKNITQEEMAKALSVTPQAVSRWETGQSYPDIAMIPEIVKYLDVSADELLGSSKADGKLQMATPATAYFQAPVHVVCNAALARRLIPAGETTETEPDIQAVCCHLPRFQSFAAFTHLRQKGFRQPIILSF